MQKEKPVSSIEPPSQTNSLPPLWRNRDYMLLWSGQVVSSVGTQVSQYAFPLLLLMLTGSALSAGLSFALHSLPMLVLSLPAGVLVDRWNRRSVMMICDTGRALCLLSVSLAAWAHVLTPELLYLASLLEGVLFVFFNIAEAACLPRIVPRQQLATANTQNVATDTLSMIIGPLLCGALYSIVNVLPFLADAISYVVSVVSLAFIKAPLQEARVQEKRYLWQEIREGVTWIWQHPLIRFLALVSAGKNFVGAGFLLLIIILAQRMHASAFVTTSIFTIGGIGSILGTVLAPWLQKRLPFGVALSIVSWLLALFMALSLLAFNPFLLGLVTACIFICTMNQSILLTTYRQALVPDKLQGRVSSIYRLVVFGGQPLGAAFIGWLLQVTNVAWTIGVCTTIFASIALAIMCNPHVRTAHLSSS